MTVGIALIAAIVAALVTWFAVKARGAALLGPVEILLSENALRMSEVFECRLVLRPTGRLTVNSIRVRLACYEWIQWRERQTRRDSKGRSSSRTVTRTRTHTLHEVEEVLGARELTTAGLDQTWVWTIPRRGPPSFQSADNALRWRVFADFDIAGWPDVTEERELFVEPARLAEDDDGAR